jgi:hypothetical protein
MRQHTRASWSVKKDVVTPNQWVGARNLHMFFMRTDLKARYSVNKLFSPWFFYFLRMNAVAGSKEKQLKDAVTNFFGYATEHAVRDESDSLSVQISW